MSYKFVHKKICSSKCIYFPDVTSANMDFHYDDSGVKHRIKSEKYICYYTNEEVKLNKKCKHCKEKVKICPVKNVENAVQTS